MSNSSTSWQELMQTMKIIADDRAMNHQLSADQQSTILRKRAKLLSSSPEETDDTDDKYSILEFRIGHELYSLTTAEIAEVIESKNITRIPLTPAHISGVINHRGRVITVIDLRQLLKLDTGGLEDLPRVIVVKFRQGLIGLLADRIIGTRAIDTNEVEKHDQGRKGLTTPYMKGITMEGSILLDAEKLFNDSSLLVDHSKQHQG